MLRSVPDNSLAVPMNEKSHWNPHRAISLIALLHLALPFLFIVQGNAAISSALSVDDTYYYLQTAWNAARVSMVSFDGLHPTNGVHFLWFSALRALAELFENKEHYLQSATALSVVLSCIPYIYISKLASAPFAERAEGSGTSAAYAVWVATAWFVCCYTQDRLCLSTMESSCHAAIVWAALHQATLVVRREDFSRLRWLVFVALLVANAWVRLDSAVISATLFVATAWHIGRQDRKCGGTPQLSLPVLFASAGLVLAGAGVEFAFLYQSDQHFLPVSGEIKHANADYSFPAVAFKTLAVLSPVGQGISRWLPLLGTTLGVQALRHTQRRGGGYFGISRALAQTLRNWALGIFTYALLSSGIFDEYFTWYLAPSFALLSLLAPYIVALFLSQDRLVLRLAGGAVFFVVVDLLEESAPRRVLGLSAVFAMTLVIVILWRRYGRSFALPHLRHGRGACLAGVCLCAILGGHWGWSKSRNWHSGQSLYDIRYRSALWLKSNTAKDAVVASWNAGQLGFYSERSVINLDGLINSHQFFRTVLLPDRIAVERQQALGQYLDEQQVEYLVDYQFHLLNKEYISDQFVLEISFKSRNREILVYRRRRITPRQAS